VCAIFRWKNLISGEASGSFDLLVIPVAKHPLDAEGTYNFMCVQFSGGKTLVGENIFI